MSNALPITNLPAIILCKCATKCLCMEMHCDSCDINILFHATDLKIAQCSCKEYTEHYNVANDCRCSKKCICNSLYKQ
jgi:hypothetical protein